MKTHPIYLLVLLLSVSFCHSSKAESDPLILSQELQQQVIGKLKNEIINTYVDPEIAESLVNELESFVANDLEGAQTDGHKFSQQLTQILQKNSNDLHLRVHYNEDVMDQDSQTDTEFEMAMWKKHNYGFETVQRLPFNIGYLQLTAFAPVSYAKKNMAAAMNLVNNTESLIIDLRGNFGGDEKTVQLLASYFLNKPTHLLDMYKRKTDSIDPSWSLKSVDGERYDTNKKVLILVDKESFSAAEDFSYTMKNLKRATIVGETTAGAANSGDDVQLTQQFSAFIPNGRPISPITGSNWEGTGVSPDVQVPSEQALHKAQILILEGLLSTSHDPRLNQRIESRIKSLEVDGTLQSDQ